MKTIATQVLTGVGQRGSAGELQVSLPVIAKIEHVVPGANRNDAILVYSHTKEPKKYESYMIRWVRLEDGAVHQCREEEKMIGVAFVQISPIDSAPYLFTYEKQG